MIEAYLAMTPAAVKVPIMLEEVGETYNFVPVNVGKGDQHRPEFRVISPNGKIPAIVDHAPPDGGAPMTLFESAAILLYLADKHDCLLSREQRGRAEALQWLFWQAAGLSPMSGQLAHFTLFAPEDGRAYGLQRYHREVNRLYGVLNQQLSQKPFLAGEYSIADIAAYPWARLHAGLNQDITPFPHLQRWLKEIAARPAVKQAYAVTRENAPDVESDSPAFRANMFGMDAAAFGLA
ncbi:MAG: glutathione S-transferase N-terminal domain-containing protein [Caulobacteraceae bacterium]|nr:glutathione S-transferase N-terminal domain-containing protein [Caulobacteraceae bacterium]